MFKIIMLLIYTVVAIFLSLTVVAIIEDHKNNPKEKNVHDNEQEEI